MTSGKRSGRSVVFIVAALLLLAGAAGFLTYQLRFNPKFVWLTPQNGAEWIRFDRPMSPLLRFDEDEADDQKVTVEFRKVLDVEQSVADAVLTFRALESCSVSWDGQVLLKSLDAPSGKNWKRDRQVRLPANIPAGRHELRMTVANNNGPPMLLAYCESLKLTTNSTWDAAVWESAKWKAAEWKTADTEKNWSRAITAGEFRPLPISESFPPAHFFLIKLIPFATVVALLVAAIAWAGKRPPLKLLTDRFTFSAGKLRWLLIAAWTVLAVNNNWKQPLTIGFDARQHWHYIFFIVENKALPLATHGWQMFQSPLYYFLSALTFSVSSLGFETETAQRVTRLIPLLCGAVQIELCYRGLRYVFPRRTDLQCLGLLLGGLLPMNLYLSQGFSNEPLAGVLSAATVVLLWRFLRDPLAAQSGRLQVCLGLLLGLAILSKVTHLLLVPPAMLLLVYAVRQAGRGNKYIAVVCTRVLITSLLVAGWFFIRNWIELGNPLITRSVLNEGQTWWQDPGYRTVQQLTSFGRCLNYPIYSSCAGFWDGFYSTFWLDSYLNTWVVEPTRSAWNAMFLIPGAWFGLLPTLAILLGAGSALRNQNKATRGVLLFSVLTIGIYVSAMLYLWLQVPIYSSVKATYTIGLIPCYAALGAAGFDRLTRHPVLRRIAYVYMSSWAVCTYLAYFVLR